MWQYIENRLPTTLTVGHYQYKTDYRIRLVTNVTTDDFQKWDLEIRKTKLEDEGTYVCRVTNNGISLRRVIYLKVEIKMTIDPVNPSVFYKDSLIIFCNTSYQLNIDNDSQQAKLSNNIEWFKNNETNRLDYYQREANNSGNYFIENSYTPTYSSQLRIIHIKSSNIATYFCKFQSQNVSTTLKKSSSTFKMFLIFS
jgi:hypothetical protein